MFGELQVVSRSLGSQESGMPDWMNVGSTDREDDEEPMEEERSWRDPGAHKIRSAVGKWLRDDNCRMIIIRVSDALLFWHRFSVIDMLYRIKLPESGWIGILMNRSFSLLSANAERWPRSITAISCPF